MFLSIPVDMEDVKKIVDEKRISRMPISRSESLDDTFGIVYVKDLFNLNSKATSVEVENLVKDNLSSRVHNCSFSIEYIKRESSKFCLCN